MSVAKAAMLMMRSLIHDWSLFVKLRNRYTALGCKTFLLYLLVSTRAVIGQFSGPYSPVRPAKI